jgi:Tol biopolymer transport system component
MVRDVVRWAALPAAVFALVFGTSLAYFELSGDDGDPEARRAAARAESPGRLVVTYSLTAQDVAQGFLATIASDGSDLRNLIEPPREGGAAIASPSVSPDGQMAAFQLATVGPGSPAPPYIHVIPLDGSKPEQRVTRGGAAEVDPAWSPDGKRLAFARRLRGGFDLFLCAPDGSGLARLTNTPGVNELSPAWSPDGTRIAFARYARGAQNGSGDLWVADVDGGDERRLFGDEHDYWAPAWSPDGRRLALLMDAHVAVADADGGAPRQLMTGPNSETRPSWSPDGARIAFTRNPGTLHTIEPDGLRPANVPFERAASGVAWAAAP